MATTILVLAYTNPAYSIKLKSNHGGQTNVWLMITFRQLLTHSLTFTRGWAPRPFSISLTSAGAVSIADNVAPIAGVVGCWSNCGVRELHLTIYWIIQTATINCNCRRELIVYMYPLRCSQKVQRKLQNINYKLWSSQCKILQLVSYNCEITLTAKFSRSLICCLVSAATSYMQHKMH